MNIKQLIPVAKAGPTDPTRPAWSYEVITLSGSNYSNGLGEWCAMNMRRVTSARLFVNTPIMSRF